jgi:cobalt/nickel transport system ATP-binding protein
MQPEVILLDEPSNGLDREIFARLVRLLNNMDRSFLIISHYPDFLNQVTNIQYTMTEGRLVRI